MRLLLSLEEDRLSVHRKMVSHYPVGATAFYDFLLHCKYYILSDYYWILISRSTTKNTKQKSLAKNYYLSCSKIKLNFIYTLFTLLHMYQFYMITVGIDVVKLSSNQPLLFLSLGLDALAMGAIILGVRGVALEAWPLILLLDVAILLVAVGHGLMVACCSGGVDGSRHRGLTAANFLFDACLAKLALLYTVLFLRFQRLKPADYDEQLKRSAGKKTGGLVSGTSEGDQLTEEATGGGGPISAAETGKISRLLDRL